MPWLAELVESSEGSLDVLPVQCLCEFLLHESQDTPKEITDDESAKFEKHKKRQVGVNSRPFICIMNKGFPFLPNVRSLDIASDILQQES